MVQSAAWIGNWWFRYCWKADVGLPTKIDLLLAHLLGDLQRMLVNPSHKTIGVRTTLARALVAVNDNTLATSAATGEDDDHTPGFHKLRHPNEQLKHKVSFIY